ncbi:MAG TPA: DUF177 domain-containing protein [Alphaproteobacteria bacterium]|nr:DUF177 domain-containing protein [Alphaproteobacteria bacterium]
MSSLTFSVNIETLSSIPHDFYLVATAEEKLAITKRLKLLQVDQIDAELHLQKDGHIALTGHIKADVTQQCVRTLVPVPEHLEIDVDEFFFFAPHETKAKEEIDLNMLETGEVLHEDILDLGEIVIQLISLNLDPYPVAPDSKPFEYHDENGASSPFDVLKKKE